MNKTTTFLVIVITALSFTLGATIKGKAQEKSFPGIVPFSAGADRIGFLDQNNGRVYVYDNNIVKCVFTGQIVGLGKAIEIVAPPTLTTADQ